VDAVVTGGIHQQADTLTVHADLVKVSDGTQLWGEQYNRQLSDIVSVQSNISKEISEQLRVKLTGDQDKRLSKHYTENSAAYQLYLQGLFYWNLRTADGIKRSIDYFQHAIQKDPNYALAYAGISISYLTLADYNFFSSEESLQKAKESALRGVEMDESLAEAHTALAGVKGDLERDGTGSEREYKRALELNPNYVTAHHWYAIYLGEMGRPEEAISEIKKAQESDPFSAVISANVCSMLLDGGKIEEGFQECKKTIQLDPNLWLAHDTLGYAYTQKKEYSEAISEYQKSFDLSKDRKFFLKQTGFVYALWGKRDEAANALNELIQISKNEYVPPSDIAAIYAGLGDKDQTFQYLEAGFHAPSNDILGIKSDRRFDSIRSDPRYSDLLRRLKLP